MYRIVLYYKLLYQSILEKQISFVRYQISQIVSRV